MKPERAQIWIQGLMAGLIGYAAVALFFAVVNLFAGRSPFHTPALLGSVLFYGLRDPAQLVIEPGPVLAYNGLHLVVFLMIGLVAAFLVFEAELHHYLWYIVFFLFLAGFLLSIAVVGALGAELARLLPWWSVLLGNLAWASAMAAYLWGTHRNLIRSLEAEQRSGND